MIEILPNWHPIFVHFTVSLFTVSTLFYFLTAFTNKLKINHEFLVVARWCLWLSATITVGTIIAGFYAYNTVAHDGPSHAAMSDHRNWALVTFAVIVALAIGSFLRRRCHKSASVLFLIGMLIGLGLLMATAWRGGELVYRHGLGVMTLPKANKIGHLLNHGEQHEHGSANNVMKKENKASVHPHADGHDH